MTQTSVGRARVRRAAGALRRLLRRRPAGLLTDIDGTISRITARNQEATVTPAARRALSRLASELDAVGVVTGRGVERARAMVGVPGLEYVGNHGLEWLRDGVVQIHPAGLAARPAFDAVIGSIRAGMDDPGLEIEDKGASIAVHYRRTADPPAAERRLFALLRPAVEAGAVRVIEGALVANLLPPAPIDKGEAVRRLVEERGLRSVAFFGDDVTDLHAFRAIRAIREGGRVDALAVGVVHADSPPEIRAEADFVLDGVDEVERVLTALAANPPGRHADGPERHADPSGGE